MKITIFSFIISLILLAGIILTTGCVPDPPNMDKTENLSIEGFVRGIEIHSNTDWMGKTHRITAVWFEDGRVKYFLNSVPDMVKQGYNNKIYYQREYHGDTFWDRINKATEFPEPKEPKPEN
jgi:hypothetical protein